MSHEALVREFARLRLEAERLTAESAALQTANAALRAELDEARALIADLRRQLFGVKADRLTPEQEAQIAALQQDLAEAAARPRPASDEVLADERRVTRKARRRPPRGGPATIETETVTLEPEATTCPCCGEPLRRIGEEVTEETDFIPATLIRRRTVRRKYACRCGEAKVVIAPLPPRLIPQSTLGLGLAVHILLTRYDDHLSFYPLEQQFWERHGVTIPRSQMVQWVEHLAGWLRPIYDAMWRDVLASDYVQVDETPVRVLDPDVKGRAPRGYLWFNAPPGGDVLLDFDRHRSLAPLQQRLQGFTGTIQTDAYAVYQALASQQPGLTRIGCLAHVRRRLYAALKEALADAVWFIAQIGSLYRIEDEARDLTAAARQARRQREAPAIWAALKAKAEALQPTVLPKSTMGKALSYFLDEYDALVGYLRDGRFQIDNNLKMISVPPRISDGAIDVTGAIDLYVQRLAREVAPVRLSDVSGGEVLRQLVTFKPRRLGSELFHPELVRLAGVASRTYQQELAGNRLCFIAFKQTPWYMTGKFAIERSQITFRTPYFDSALVKLAYRVPSELVGSPLPALRLIAEGNRELSHLTLTGDLRHGHSRVRQASREHCRSSRSERSTRTTTACLSGWRPWTESWLRFASSGSYWDATGSTIFACIIGMHWRGG